MSASESWFPPLSPLPTPEGTFFRVVSRSAPQVVLQLYDDVRASRPSRTFPAARLGDVWEVFVPKAGAGQAYTWAVDPDRPLLDPYALAVAGPDRFGSDAPDRPRPPFAQVNRDATFKSLVVAPPKAPDWKRPATPWHETIVYELHVRGFTRAAGGEAPGTYAGLAGKLDHLRDLGVTAVELLPVHEFDETEVRRGHGLFNYWGYSPVQWLAPNRRYAAGDDPVAEFRAMARALHDAGIQLIVDVVFNHTGELDDEGPTWNLRGLDDEVYYLKQALTGEYVNLTGCGNTVNAQHPTVRALIRHALRWWVHGLGVDGFRFDLATILARDEHGHVMTSPPLLREIEEDPWLRGVHLIAEAWDAAGGYLVGKWPGNERWAVWNDRFRDDVRRAWLGHGDAATLASRLSGSADLLPVGPPRGVNYITAHDGFTLADVVSYSRKHNEANGEGNHDGHGHEVSDNHGAEGPSEYPQIVAARDQSRRNLMASLLLAQGVPMLLAGDELGRTQKGNNNAYCHDGPMTWLDWDKDAAGFDDFVRGLIRLRKRHTALGREVFLEDDHVHWFGPEGKPVDWKQGAFGYALDGLLVLVNLTPRPQAFTLPAPARLVVDTARAPYLHKGGARTTEHELLPRSLAAFETT